MSLRDDLAGVLARDPRYTIHAYAFVFESLEYTKSLKKRSRAPRRAPGEPAPPKGRRTKVRHVTGRELCEGARLLALAHYGMLAIAVLGQWGIRSTADLGEIVYNLIDSGDLERSPTDSKDDFVGVFDFETALRRNYILALDDVA